MLQRGNSDAAQRVRRAKSTSSVHKRLTKRSSHTINPEQAREDAITAATRAYEQTLLQLKSTNALERRPSRAKPALHRQGSHLARSRSRTENKAAESTAKLSKAQPSDLRGTALNTESFGVHCPGLERRDTITTTDAVEPDLETTGSQHNSATPQLRERQPNLARRPATPLAYENDESRQLSDNITFLAHSRPVRRDLQAAREQQTDDEILATAREIYLEEKQIHNQQHGRSSVLVPFSLRSRKYNRQSLDTDVSHDGACSGEMNLKNSGLNISITETKARRISMTLRNTLRRAMGRSTESSSSMVVPQHVESLQAHYGNPAFRRREMTITPATTPRTSEDIQERGVELTPPPRFRDGGHSIVIDRRSVCHSQSSDDLRRPKSRVTSWADTTHENTILIPNIPELPCINEVSEPYSILPEPLHDPGTTINKDATGKPLRKSSSKFQISAGIDGRQLLSALRQRLGPEKTRIPCSDSTTSESSNIAREAMKAMHEGLPAGQQKGKDIPVPEEIQLNNQPCYFVPDQSHSFRGPTRQVSESRRSSNGTYTYDARIFPSTLRKRTGPAGTAVVMASQPVTKWIVGSRRNRKERSEPQTSGEWRTWAAEEFAGFEGGPFVALPETSLVTRYSHGDTQMPETGDVAVLEQMSKRDVKYQSHNRDYATNINQPSILNRGSSEHTVTEFPAILAGRSTSKEGSLSSRELSLCQLQFPQPPTFAALRHSANTGHNSKVSGKFAAVPSQVHEKLKVRKGPLEGRGRASLDKTQSQVGDAQSHATERKVSKKNSTAVLAESRADVMTRNQQKSYTNAGQLDDKFLYRIRRGPYESASSPSAAAASSAESLDLLAGRRPFGRVPKVNTENEPPSSGQRMVDDFLVKRSSKLENILSDSPTAFL